ncbi:MAG: hypothetical protein ACI4N4_05355 [Candidatus Fimenecus sp.]
MRLFKSRRLLAVIADLLVISMAVGLSACKNEKDGTEPPSSTEPTTEALMTAQELANVIIPAVIKSDMATVLGYSFVDVDKAFEDKISDKGMDRTVVYKDLSESLGTEINSYTDFLKKQSAIQEDALKIQFGEDFKITFEIVENNVCTPEEREEKIINILAKLENGGFSSARYFDPSKAEEFREIDFDYTIEGSKNKQSAAKIITLCKYDGKWVYGDVEMP